jgi:hypothetical protein
MTMRDLKSKAAKRNMIADGFAAVGSDWENIRCADDSAPK